MEAVASSLKSENDIYIGTIIDQVLIFNQHSIQLISGLIDYAECRNSRFQKKEDAVFIDHISKNEGASMFSTKTRKKMSSKMKSRATSRQSRIAFKNKKKEANTKECLKHHLEHMFHYFIQIYPRLIEEIKFLDFENYFPLCKEIMTFFVNYVKLFYLKKHMYKPQEFMTFRDNSKTFIRLVTPFIEKVTPIITEYLSYDPEKNDKRFDWDSIDIKSSYSPYKKNSSLYKFETNILINFRDVIDWIICILSLINTKKIVKEDSSERKNKNIEDTFQFPEKFQPLLELVKKEKIQFNITDDFRKNTKQTNKKKLKKQIENEQQKAKEEKMNLQVQATTTKTGNEKTKENTKTKNVELKKPTKKVDKEQLDQIRYAPDFLLPQNAYDFIDNYYVFMKPEDAKDQDKKEKEKEKADKQEEKSQKNDNDNEDNIVTFHTPQMIMLNCALNSILPLIRQKDTSLYFNIPKALSALGLSSFEIMREFQNPKLDDVLYKHNELMLNISLVLSCVVSFIHASEEMTQTFFDFICERTCPLIYKIADSSSVNSDLTINILEAVYAIVNIVMDSKMSVHKQIQNQLEKECQDNNIYFSLIAVRISLLRILYCFLYLQSQSQLIGAFQMVQLLSQLYFNSNFIDNIEDLLMNVTRVEKMSFMLCNPLKFFSKFPDFKFQNNFFPAEIITRSMNFAFYNLEFGTRTIYVFNEETDDKNINLPQNFNTLIELNKRVNKRMITFILTNIKEKQLHKESEDKDKDKDKKKDKDKEKEKEKQLKANANREAKIRRYYANRTLVLIDELGFESISTENNTNSYVDFHELTKKAIRRAMKLHAKKQFIEINSKEQKGGKKKDKKKKDDNKDEEKKRKEEEKKKKEEEKKKKEKEKEKEKEKKKKDGNNNKDKKKKNDKKSKNNNDNITNYEFINGDKLCRFIFDQLNFFSPSFYRNGYFIDVIRCCNKIIKRFYFNYFIGIENNAHDPIFNSIIEISKVIELLHPEAISEIALYSENDSMRQHIMDLVNEVVSAAISKLNNKNVNNRDNDDIEDINTKHFNILKIGRAHNFRQLLNVAVKISWRHTDPVITTNYGMLRKQTKCGISLHPGNDEKMFSISTNSPQKFEEYFPVLLCKILTKENFFHEDDIFFDAEKLCYPTYEFFPNGILYSLCATYFHCPYEKSNGSERKRIHEMTKKVLRLVHEKVYNEQMELLNKPEEEYNSNFIKLSRIQYRAYYFLGKAINLSPVLTNRDVENYFSPYFLDEAIKFLSKYDTKEWHIKEEKKMSKKQKEKIDTDFHVKHKKKNSQDDESTVRSCLNKFLKDLQSTKNNENTNNTENTKNKKNNDNKNNQVNNDVPKPEKKHNIISDLLKAFPSPGLLNGVIEEEESNEVKEEESDEEEPDEIQEEKENEKPIETIEIREEEEEAVEPVKGEEKPGESKEEPVKPEEVIGEEKPVESKEEKQGESKEEKQGESKEEKQGESKEEKQGESKEEKQGESKEEKQGESKEEKQGESKEEKTGEPKKKKILNLDKILEEENESNRNRYYRNFDDGNFLFQSGRDLSRFKQYDSKRRRGSISQPKPSTPEKAQPKPSTPEKAQPKPSTPEKAQQNETANDNGNSPLTKSAFKSTAPESPQQNEPPDLSPKPRKEQQNTKSSRNSVSFVLTDNIEGSPQNLSATTQQTSPQRVKFQKPGRRKTIAGKF